LLPLFYSYLKYPILKIILWHKTLGSLVSEKEYEENNIYGNTLEFSVESPIPLHAYSAMPILTKNYLLKYNLLQDECTNITTLKNKEEIKHKNLNNNNTVNTRVLFLENIEILSRVRGTPPKS
jgi:hypothetical protein